MRHRRLYGYLWLIAALASCDGLGTTGTSHDDGTSWPNEMFWTFVVWLGGSVNPDVSCDVPVPDASLAWQGGTTYRWHVESFAPEWWVLPDRVFRWRTMKRMTSAWTKSVAWTFTTN